MTDPLNFASKHAKYHPYDEFTFSIQSVEDAIGTRDNSGAYNMNVESNLADTDQMMAI